MAIACKALGLGASGILLRIPVIPASHQQTWKHKQVSKFFARSAEVPKKFRSATWSGRGTVDSSPAIKSALLLQILEQKTLKQKKTCHERWQRTVAPWHVTYLGFLRWSLRLEHLTLKVPANSGRTHPPLIHQTQSSLGKNDYKEP